MRPPCASTSPSRSAAPARAAPVALARLPERIEDVRQPVRGDAAAGVGDPEQHLPVSWRCADGDRRLPGREFDCVAYQVLEHLEEAVLIAPGREGPARLGLSAQGHRGSLHLVGLDRVGQHPCRWDPPGSIDKRPASRRAIQKIGMRRFMRDTARSIVSARSTGSGAASPSRRRRSRAFIRSPRADCADHGRPCRARRRAREWRAWPPDTAVRCRWREPPGAPPPRPRDVCPCVFAGWRRRKQLEHAQQSLARDQGHRDDRDRRDRTKRAELFLVLGPGRQDLRRDLLDQERSFSVECRAEELGWFPGGRAPLDSMA